MCRPKKSAAGRTRRSRVRVEVLVAVVLTVGWSTAVVARVVQKEAAMADT
jgi:hypothetical protein